MALVFLVSREPRMRDKVSDYLRERGYEAATATSYDDAMDEITALNPAALIVDVQGVPRGEVGITFPTFSQWMATRLRPDCNVIYLLRKGMRRPTFRIDGPVIKKPFPIEALGEALREQIGSAGGDGHIPGIKLDLSTNTLHGLDSETHLTNMEATLLAYLMQHPGEILNPRELLMDVWQYRDPAGASTLVRAHMSNLRRKLRDVAGPANYIQTVRGKGYRFIA